MENINIDSKDLKKLIEDIAQIKEMLIKEREEKELEEIELTNWAKNELKEARARKRKISNKEIKRYFEK